MLILSGPPGSSACKDTVCAVTEHACSSIPRNMIQKTYLALEAKGRSRQTPSDMITRVLSIYISVLQYRLSGGRLSCNLSHVFSTISCHYRVHNPRKSSPSAIRLPSPRDAVSAGSSRSRRLPLLLGNGVDARGPHQLRPAVADRCLKPATGAGHKGARSENDLKLQAGLS